MSRFETVPLDHLEASEWDQFCDENSSAWFWHTTAGVEYHLNMRPDLRPKERSFGIVHNGRLVGVCPLIEESWPSTGIVPPHAEFSFGGAYGPAPAVADDLGDRDRREASDVAISEVNRLATERGVGRILFFVSPLMSFASPASDDASVMFARHGYIDTSIATQVLDLAKDSDDLLKAMSKGHRADIKRGQRGLDCQLYLSENITPVVFERYRRLHAAAAGRVTRHPRTFEIMYELIVQGRAVLACAEENGQDVGFSYTIAHGRRGYYWSACSDRARRDQPIAHALQWATIQWLKGANCETYEMGWQPLGPRMHLVPTSKELSVAKFKRGFGGRTVPLVRTEKYLTRSLFEIVMSERVGQFTSTLDRE